MTHSRISRRAETPQGTTRYRPPYTPVSFALLADGIEASCTTRCARRRCTSGMSRHRAVFENVGQWKRPWYYPQPGEENRETAVLRECRAARTSVAVMDAATLGKIDIQGPDAGEFLNRMYTNASTPSRSATAGTACCASADGMVFDDGVVMHVGERPITSRRPPPATPPRYWTGSRSGCRLSGRTSGPLHVRHGPLGRDRRGRTPIARGGGGPIPRADNGRESPSPSSPYGESETHGIPVRLHRITFSGELAYELWTPNWYGLALWELVMEAGKPLGHHSVRDRGDACLACREGLHHRRPGDGGR